MSLLLPTYRAKDYYIVLKRWTKKNSFIVYTIILVTQGRKEQIYFNNPISYYMITKRNNFLLSGLRTYLAQQQKKCNKCSAWFCKYLIISPSKQKENCKSHSNLHFLCWQGCQQTSLNVPRRPFTQCLCCLKCFFKSYSEI